MHGLISLINNLFNQQQLCESCAAEDASHLVTFLASSGESLLAVYGTKYKTYLQNLVRNPV